MYIYVYIYFLKTFLCVVYTYIYPIFPCFTQRDKPAIAIRH